LSGAGGTELAFAATRSLTVTFALHLAILAALGEDPASAWPPSTPEQPDIGLPRLPHWLKCRNRRHVGPPPAGRR
jgi:hypothetical protein